MLMRIFQHGKRVHIREELLAACDQSTDVLSPFRGASKRGILKVP